jgi:hypothetical protein
MLNFLKSVRLAVEASSNYDANLLTSSGIFKTLLVIWKTQFCSEQHAFKRN